MKHHCPNPFIISILKNWCRNDKIKSPSYFWTRLLISAQVENPFKTGITKLKHISTLEKHLSETQSCVADFQQVNNSTNFRLICSENIYFVYEIIVSARCSKLVQSFFPDSFSLIIQTMTLLIYTSSIKSLTLAFLKRRICNEKKPVSFLCVKRKFTFSRSRKLLTFSEEVCVAWLAVKPQLFRSARLTNPAV